VVSSSPYVQYGSAHAGYMLMTQVKQHSNPVTRLGSLAICFCSLPPFLRFSSDSVNLLDIFTILVRCPSLPTSFLAPSQ
jgi:hypothetical protein